MRPVLPAVIFTLAQQILSGAQAPPPPAPAKVDAARQGFLLLVLVIGLGAGACAALAAAWVLRRWRARRERRRAGPVKTPVSAWEQAGERARIPSAKELEIQAGQPAAKVRDVTPAPERLQEARAAAGTRPVALVTGAARRVGRMIALELAGAGCDVIVTYRRSSEEADDLAHAVSDLGATATLFEADLSIPDDVERLARQVLASFPRIDVLVHNAATYDASPLENLNVADAERQYRVNALAPLLLTARLRPLLDRSTLAGGACVVAITDIHAMGRPRKGFAAYMMSKAGLNEMVRSLSLDLAPKVRVCGVALGVAAFPETGKEADPAWQARYLKDVPLARAGEPLDAARAVKWLAFEATYLTGTIIRMDGGRWLT